MISKLKGIVLAVILSLASIMMPFDIYADTISNSNVHLNTSLKEIQVINTSKYYTYNYELVFDKEYVGWVSVKVVSTYFSDNNNTQSQNTFTKAVYVNGNKSTITTTFVSTGNFSGQGCLLSANLNVENSNVVPYGELDSLDTIIDLLTDISNYVSINVLDELQTIVTNTSLANQYLNNISKIRSWNIPFESLSINLYLLEHYDTFEKVYFNNYSYIENYPCVKTSSIKPLFSTYLGENPNGFNNKMTFVVISNLNLSTINQIYDMFQIDNSKYTVSDYNYLDYFNGYYLVKFDISTNTSGTFNLIPKFTNYYFIGIMAKYTAYVKKISTDFALKFGLSNQLLDDLHIIAQGTNQSNSASSNLEDEASEYSDIADDVIGVEEGLTSNFETEVNKIDLNSGLNVFGGNFMTSATWVRTQFDRLTENTPYGSLVVYGLTLGFALLMLGKVFL